MDQTGARQVDQAVDDASQLHFGSESKKQKYHETLVFKALHQPRLVQNQKKLFKQGRFAPVMEESDEETENQETTVAPGDEDGVACQKKSHIPGVDSTPACAHAYAHFSRSHPMRD